MIKYLQRNLHYFQTILLENVVHEKGIMIMAVYTIGTPIIDTGKVFFPIYCQHKVEGVYLYTYIQGNRTQAENYIASRNLSGIG